MKKTEKWPLKVWCVCYQSTDYPGNWVPYSGGMYYYKDAAIEASANSVNSKVKLFYVGPQRSLGKGSAHE